MSLHRICALMALPLSLFAQQLHQGLIGHFPLKTQLQDQTGLNTPVNSGVSFSPDPERGSTAFFNNNAMVTLHQGDVRTLVPGRLPQSAMTAASWVKVDAADTWGGWFGAVQDDGSTEHGWILGSRGTQFSIALAGGTSGLTYLTDPANFTLGKWYHVATTYDGTTLRLFVDGVEKAATAAESSAISYPATSTWYQIGSYKDPNEDFRHQGRLQDIALWNRALSPAEITAVKDGGLYSSSLSSSAQLSSSAALSSSSVLSSSSNPMTQGLLAHLPLQTHAQDLTGKNPAPINQGVVFGTDAERGQVATFNNSAMITLHQGDVRTLVPGRLPQSAMTAASWVKVNAADAWGGWIGAVQDDGSTEHGWILGSLGTQFSIALAGGTSGLTYLTDPANFSLGKWYHVATTYDGSTLRLYVDGVEKAATVAESGAISYPSTSTWYQVGAYKDPNEDFRHDGQLQDVAVWNRALTAAEIQQVRQGALLGLSSSSATSSSSVSSSSSNTGKTPKVLVIGCDGCRADAIVAANAPTYDSLFAAGSTTLAGRNVDPTSSGPNWSSILTGVTPAKHGVYDNGFGGRNYGAWPDFMSRLEQVAPSKKTFAVVQWSPITTYITNTNDGEFVYNPDSLSSLKVVDLLNNDQPDVIFVQLDDPDHEGHATGFSPTNTKYLTKLEYTDRNIKRIMGALHARKQRLPNEDWIVILTTDHGGTGTSHGGTSTAERTIFFSVSGSNVPAKRLEGDGITYYNYDAAVTAMEHMCMTLPSGMDGKPVGVSCQGTRLTGSLSRFVSTPIQAEEAHSNLETKNCDLPQEWMRSQDGLSLGASAHNIVYEVIEATFVRIEALDAQGKTEGKVFEGQVEAGRHHMHWNPQSLSSKISYVRITANQLSLTSPVFGQNE
jgi:hypothetical protein